MAYEISLVSLVILVYRRAGVAGNMLISCLHFVRFLALDTGATWVRIDSPHDSQAIPHPISASAAPWPAPRTINQYAIQALGKLE